MSVESLSQSECWAQCQLICCKKELDFQWKTIFHWLCHWMTDLHHRSKLNHWQCPMFQFIHAGHMCRCCVTKHVDPQGLRHHRTFTGTCRGKWRTAWLAERRSSSQATSMAANLASRPFKGSDQNRRGSSFNELRPQTTGPRPRSSQGTSRCDPSATVTFDPKLPLWLREGGGEEDLIWVCH